MASFNSWMLPTKRRWRRIIAGYQDLYNDKGNWSSNQVGVGTLIGTNRSIAAPTLIAWRGRMVSKAEMEALSIGEAMQIYKVQYWDKIQGDLIQSQALADILADMKSSAGGNAIKEMQRTLNDLGERLLLDGAFGVASVQALNRQILRVGQARIFNAFRQRMIGYYQRINSPYERQLIDSLNRDYPAMKTDWTRVAVTVGVVAAAGALIVYGIYQYQQIQT
ncbi:glycosyl hydrolase 108 family protein [Aureispira sp. CCB-E]|uniref:glycosyl hydrolase 108 family protein n=1 Tax=Aureispira sp. CCB-E TaxID=3051121 RepID=UPI0028688BD0|nr:glycosyl hydrolase 108 family protein [Aureispira sp. CCB-E]WMX16329.1 glycosyl hydrolase 108 family protein [Aureispira sp. CCB-E]